MSKFIGIMLLVQCLYSCKEPQENDFRADDKYGGTVHINVADNIYSLVPPEISNDSEWFIASQIYETIIKQGSEGIIPNKGLLKAVSQVHPDTINYVFHSEISLANGNHLDSIALSHWVKQLKKSGLDSRFEQSSNTLVVTNISLEEANLQLSSRNTYLFSIVEGVPVGTGPFSLEGINEDISVDLLKNPNYHNQSIPYLDAMEVRMIKTKNTEVDEFINGSLDLIRLDPLQQLQFKNVLSLDNHPNYQISETNQRAYCFGLVHNMDSIEAYQLARVLNDQPMVFEMSNTPRQLEFPNLSRSKINTALAVDSDNSIFSQLTIENLIEKGVPLRASDSPYKNQKSLYLAKGELSDEGLPLLQSMSVTTTSADYLIILNSWSGLAVYQYYLKTEDQADRGMIDLKSVYFKEPIKLE